MSITTKCYNIDKALITTKRTVNIKLIQSFVIGFTTSCLIWSIATKQDYVDMKEDKQMLVDCMNGKLILKDEFNKMNTMCYKAEENIK